MNLFDYIKERVAMVDVAREYVSLKKAGIYYKGCCPFHQEKDASFTVSPHKGIFYCFGCHATGDAISFIAQIEGCNQFDAAKLLIEKYQLDIPAELLNEKHKTNVSFDEKNRYFNLCSLVVKWCQEELKKSSFAQQYLTTRNLESKIIDLFEIGYFPSGTYQIKAFIRFMHNNGFLLQDLIDAYIIIEGKGALYSPYEERIIFPISDHLGRHCGFGGRIFKENDERAKYYNSHENNFFNKGSLLFGLQQAKKAIQSTNTVFLVEGYTDCLMMAQNGYPQTVATLGTACTHNHLQKLTHYTETIYVLFDGDNAGFQAMLRLTQLCWDVNIDIRVICLPKNEDPASFLGGGKDLSVHINQSLDIFTFFIQYSTSQFKNQTLKKKIVIIREILNIISTIDDKLKQTLLLQDAALKLNLPLEILKNECNNFYTELSPKQAPKIQVSVSEGEKKLFALILRQPQLLEREEIMIICNAFSEPLKNILVHYQKLAHKSLSQLTELLTEEEKQLTHAIIMAHDKEHNEQSDDIIKNFVKRYWKKISAGTKEKIVQAQQINDEKQVKLLLHHMEDLKKKILNWSVQ